MVNRRSLSIPLCMILIFFSLSCQLTSPRQIAPTEKPEIIGPLLRQTKEADPPERDEPLPQDNPNVENAARTEEALYQVVEPTQTAVSEAVGEIQVDYVYTDGLVTALYHLYGSYLDHFVDITLTNNGAQTATIVVETSIEGFTTTAADTVEVGPGESVEIHQNPRLTQEAVDKLSSEQPGNFRIRVVQVDPGGDTVLVNESRQILLYSRRDFVWISGFEWQEEYELWAAWVTPTDPGVEALIRAAADYSDSGIMWNGYGGTENDAEGGVWDRLESIWDAEDKIYDLTYISTMVAFGPNTVQRMRLPAEVLDQRSGNCVELAALFASAAEALKLETAIVRIPGHAYTAVRMDEANANYYFIETTMIGRSSFEDAVNTGKKEWEDAFPHFEAKEEGYAWVEIIDAREKGILPIPWK